MNENKNQKIVCCTHPHTEHCKNCTMYTVCDGNPELLAREKLVKGLKQTNERRFALLKTDYGERLFIIGSNNRVERAYYNDEQEVYKHD